MLGRYRREIGKANHVCFPLQVKERFHNAEKLGNILVKDVYPNVKVPRPKSNFSGMPLAFSRKTKVCFFLCSTGVGKLLSNMLKGKATKNFT